MHCPVCGQQQVSEETRFCSRCGFLLTGVAEVVKAGGVVSAKSTGIVGTADSPRRRGMKKGVFWALLTILVVPMMAILTVIFRIPPFLPVLGLLIFLVGGLLRTAYAMLFESGSSPDRFPDALIRDLETRNALPPAQSVPASAYAAPAGSWRDTNELERVPGSVTDSTTKLLQKEESDQ
ncbi:MAG: hypothetical protein DMF63_13690 [Acidobacteria bacterium]|nr:MAG: hypothetical protein DMF63_13690 [Acidobacteriota bacterium]